MSNVTSLGSYIQRAAYEADLRRKFAHFSKEEMRVMWDNISDDDSHFGPYDCADIHAWMNLQGDGAYCAV